MSKSVKRLYEGLRPSHYDLKIVPDKEKLTFSGTVTIMLQKVGRPSQRLAFHQKQLRITNARIIKHDKKGLREVPVTRINRQGSLHEVRLHTAERLYSGAYEVTMDFEGVITRNLTGIYPCHFRLDGAEHIMLATQFESHHAREVFPCIDEPEAKSTFRLTLVTPAGLTVLSNTPIESQETLPVSKLKTTFATTPPMSTYLLAFVIGELHRKTTHTKSGVEVSVWATKAQPLDAFDFGLDVAKRSIEFFEDYFGVGYPLQKADHVAIPDLGAGTAAMENWGLITYREDYLLAYPGESSQASKEHIAISIAHETAHQWFGNLTTMRWWDDLWLNESFASIMEYEAIDSLFPDWHAWDEFVARDGLLALRRDATAGVQAVKTNVHHPDEIGTLFDPYIMYAKGSRILYMLKSYIGEKAFRKGLAQYFTDYAYKNTTGDDLWRALSTASDMDVAAFMLPWLERSGFPVVSIEQHGTDVTLRQQQFLEDGKSTDGHVWPVPLFSPTVGMPERLDMAQRHCTLPTKDWAYINHSSAGHYIVHYIQPAHKAHIVEQVKQRILPAADRLILLNSASMLAKAGYQPFGDVLRLLQAYEDETTEPVWSTMALIVAEARRFIDLDERLELRIKAFIRSLIERQFQQLGWDGMPDEQPAERKLRSLIISLGVYAEDSGVIAEALKRFDAYRQNAVPQIDPELRSIIFGAAIRHHATGAFSFLLKLHDDTPNSDLQGDIAVALCLTQDKKQAAILLERLQDAALVRPQDMQHWLVYLLRNRYARDAAWDWMISHWGWIVGTYSSDKSYDNFPRYTATVCNTAVWAKKYKDFFVPKQEEVALRRNILIGLSEIDARVVWLERDLASVCAFFDFS